MTIGSSPYSESLKTRRKVTASALNRPAVASYVPHIDTETRVFLQEALEFGKAGKEKVDPMPLFLLMNLSLGLTLHWGARMESQSDLFREIIHCENTISNFRSTTSNSQDYIPLLRLNPFNRSSARAKEVSARRKAYMTKMDKDLDDRLEKGTHKPSIRANAKLDPEAKLTASELTSLNVTMTAAGLDTMQSTVSWVIAILAAMPEIQEKADQAIRNKFPVNRPLCDAWDDQTIQYLVVLIKEIARFYPATRLSLPRQTLQDFTYGGKVVPKGTIIFLNAWACNMDPAIWSDPEVFRPERWLEQRDAPIFTFGVGSRMCVGIQIASRELYILFLRLINSFQIEAAGPVDSDPITGVADSSATVAMPKPFQVRLVPRDAVALREALADGES